MDKTNIKVEFTIVGKDDKFLPSIATDLLGITPTSQTIVGQVIRVNNRGKEILAQDNSWEIETDYEESIDSCIQINKVLSQLKGKEDVLRRIYDDYDVAIILMIVPQVENDIFPSFYLDKKLINYLSSINANVYFDPYYMSGITEEYITNQDVTILFTKLNLGRIITPPEPVFGGLLHEMYKAETNKGTYAVKALNSEIMKRENVIDNYLLSEKVAKIAYQKGIPAVTAIEDKNCLHQIDGRYFMVFPWVDAKSLLLNDVTPSHCVIIGKILAQLHNIDYSEINGNKELIHSTLKVDWKSYCEIESDFSEELTSILPDLYKWEEKTNNAAQQLFEEQTPCHRDMDCKNVLWDENNSPFIIDWEAAGCMHPLAELIDVAYAWSGLETEHFNVENFEAVIGSYVHGGSEINEDIIHAINYGFTGKLGWLEYNIKRSLGIEASSIQEQILGTKQVFSTIKVLENMDEKIPVIMELLKQYR